MATPSSNSVPLTHDNLFVDGLTQGSSWELGGSRTLSYSFNDYPGIAASWETAQRATILAAFTVWSNAANIHFKAISSGGYFYQTAADLAVTATGYYLYYYHGAVGAAIYPDPDLVTDRSEYPRPEGDIFLDNASLSYIGGSSLLQEVALHEIGHALGLKEPFSDGFHARPTFAELGIESYDTMRWTVMSYNVVPYADAVTPMPLDIVAIQHIYGANNTYRIGNDTYRLADDGKLKTLWDAGGIDKLSAAGLRFGITLDLREGRFSFSSLDGGNGAATAIAYHVIIEDGIGTSFDDLLIGNAARNVLDGNKGADTLSAGAGNDIYVVDNPGDRVVENADEGVDRVDVKIAKAGGNYILSDYVENARLLSSVCYGLTGNELNNVLTGNAAANLLTGGGGRDILDGKGGADILIGGAGDDVYYVDNALDVVSETDADPLIGGVDKIRSTISYNLADTDGTGSSGGNVEKLTLIGFAAINGIGNDLDNIITGNAAANILDGGIGADILIGGAGNDVYIVDSLGDDVRETSAAGGIDLVKSYVGYTLGGNLENLALLGNAVDGAGNGLNNLITGNAEGNRLYGMAGNDNLIGAAGNDTLDGGSGIDKLIGGTGNDTYIVDLVTKGIGIKAIAAWQDTVTETNGTFNGIDTLQLRGASGNSVNSNLTLAAGLENLDASQTATSKLNLVGNAAANVLTGNDASNTLNGGAGHDTLIGADGNDILIGGPGNDILQGDAGADVFRFQAALNASSNVDSILDFGSGVDTIQLENALFGKLTALGELKAANFFAGEGGYAQDTNDFILYDTDTGNLSYDPDGSGSLAAVPFVTLVGHPSISSADFVVT